MSETEPASRAPRIAIKFGTSSSSKSKSTDGHRKPGQSQPSSTLGKRQRPHALNHESESDEEDDKLGRHEVVTTFGADITDSDAKRRITTSPKSGGDRTLFMIPGQKNRDWKADVKGQRTQKSNARKRQTRPDSDSVIKETEPADQDKQIHWGLTVTKKAQKEQETASDGDGVSREANAPEAEAGDDRPRSAHTDNGDADQDAMDALLGKKRKVAKDIIIESPSMGNKSSSFSEQDAYKKRIQEAAEVSTIEEYDEIPEGEFGAALLRGMGWKGEERGPKPKEVTKRPNLMGLGSKEDEEIRKGELARKHGHRERRPRLDEYRRDKEKQRKDREERHRDSYKSERDRDRSSKPSNYKHHDSHRDRDSRRHRARD